MRYKSIRDLSSEESGKVILSVKPIWLMSPLSISDTMPLEDNQFDVVIFDEASQVRLEEAVPAIQRAQQVIVVGDEMQLPPTNFFGAGGVDEDESVFFTEDDEVVEYDLGADSFLTHSGKTLPSVMLGWHYRSRSESLISYSNMMFYNGGLLTIPDRNANISDRDPIELDGVEEFPDTSAETLSRSISYHFMKEGVYQRRQNTVEANYIAHSVRNILMLETGKSIGIVAFSEAQQQKIEDALEALARQDEHFKMKLDLERDREDDGQQCGLFVKNLENVQGDERDLMILSICYAPDQNGKMRMNFGPINRTGGEKRLNVIFSRAKHHMMIVSSIKYSQITNDYNEGANSLKCFLEYAEATSKGNAELANHVISRTDKSDSRNTQTDHFETTLATALEAKGYLVDKNIGQSQFTCDLALRLPADRHYRLGILLDGAEHYNILSPLERYLLRPEILRGFGWNILTVIAKDWFHDPEQVLNSIELVMKQEA